MTNPAVINFVKKHVGIYIAFRFKIISGWYKYETLINKRNLKMKHYGANIHVSEGTAIKNLTAPSGTTYPDNANVGELFYRTDLDKLYVCTTGGSPASWTDITIIDTITFADVSDVDFTGSPALSTGDTIKWNGSKWVHAKSTSGASDHGALTGLADDDHIQYYLADGTRSVTGSIIPDTDIAYDLGSPSARFRDLYLSGQTIYIGTHTLYVDPLDDKLKSNGQKVITNDILAPEMSAVITADPSIIPETSTIQTGWNDMISGMSTTDTPAAYSPVGRAFGPDGLIKELEFAVDDYVYVESYHTVNDVDPGAQAYIHIHWSTNGVNQNPVVWEVTFTQAKGHNQQNFGTSTTIQITGVPDGGAWRHYTTSANITDAITLNEPDELVLVTLKRATNGATDNGDQVFGLKVAMHYQTTRSNTPTKAPPYYA